MNVGEQRPPASVDERLESARSLLPVPEDHAAAELISPSATNECREPSDRWHWLPRPYFSADDSGRLRMRSAKMAVSVGSEGVEMALSAVIPDNPPKAFVSRRRLYSVDLASTTVAYPFGRETFTRCEDAERFIEEFRHDEPKLAAELTIKERELSVDGPR
jgi:hypothetical protein